MALLIIGIVCLLAALILCFLSRKLIRKSETCLNKASAFLAEAKEYNDKTAAIMREIKDILIERIKEQL